jgi:putative DNA methylase
MTGYKRKLIEVALPLEAINRACQHEKSVPRKGHPATMHLWWARRPLAACRAVLFAQLVDDPSAHPDRFPTEEAQAVERRRLFDLLERLVVWENAGNEVLLRQAHEEIARSFDGDPPSVLDPFAGGGSIPLEAQRLGLEAHASDLNPVAVLINKALIEIPPRWAGQQPVFPGAAQSRLGGWGRASGLAEDVRRYGTWMRDEAATRIGHLYTQTALPDGSPATVIAWLWARTVTCPNPACGATLPLVSSLWLSKKKARPTWLRPLVTGTDVTFEVVVDSSGPPDSPKQGRGAKFACLVCGDVTTDAYVKAEGMAGRMGQQLLATVAEGQRQRVYLSPTRAAAQTAEVARPDDAPETEMAVDPRNIWCVNYGLRTFADLFTARQLTALTTVSDLVGEARKTIEADARTAGVADAEQYAADIATYLSFAVSKLADWSSSICSWIPQIEGVRNTFARQAIPMVWDYVEVNPLSSAVGNFTNHVEWVSAGVLGTGWQPAGSARQSSADVAIMAGSVVTTDPPYYDNIGYSDLSDFFYVWLRRSLRDVHPDLLSTLLTPKADELIASPYRFEGSKARAEEHFETGFVRTFQRIRESHPLDVPITVFYAFKQAESDDAGTASTGWETMLNGLIEAGLTVTATWPMRTERSARSIGIGTNALASSIVLACRPREATAEATTRRGFLQALKDELPTALREMQQGSLAPVDLAQAAIGPGMAVFTRYRTVVEADGSAMTVRTALALINQVLDEVLSEQEGDFDADTRFCVKWFSQFGWDEAESGTADTLSRATNTSVAGLDRGGIFRARAGRARLVPPEEMSTAWNPLADDRVSVWEVVVRLARALDTGGAEEAARLMAGAGQRVNLDTAKELAYLLYSICEKHRWTQTALLFNGLGTSWSDLSAAARVGGALTPPPAQGALDFDGSE